MRLRRGRPKRGQTLVEQVRSLIGGDDYLDDAVRMLIVGRQWVNDPAGQQHVHYGTFDTGGGYKYGRSGILEAKDEWPGGRGDPDDAPRRPA